MKVGIAGLGLIGGSFAKAYKQNEDTEVLGFDSNSVMLNFAQMAGAVDGVLNENNIGECDLVLIALYPQAAIDYMEQMAEHFGGKPVVIDCCGTKRRVCDAGFALAKEYGFTYVGGHPMAGNQHSGFKYSRPTLFRDSSMIIVPPVYDDIAFLDRVKQLLIPAGFGRVTVTTADKHDEVIAFTSQLAHVVSNAYIKSPTVQAHKGFSAGSYKDLTRVAWLNEYMWTELFFENKEHLLDEMKRFIGEMNKYVEAMEADDSERLRELLAEGRILKEESMRREGQS